MKRTKITFYNVVDARKLIAFNQRTGHRLMRMPAFNTVELIGELDDILRDVLNWLEWKSVVTFKV